MLKLAIFNQYLIISQKLCKAPFRGGLSFESSDLIYSASMQNLMISFSHSRDIIGGPKMGRVTVTTPLLWEVCRLYAGT